MNMVPAQERLHGGFLLSICTLYSTRKCCHKLETKMVPAQERLYGGFLRSIVHCTVRGSVATNWIFALYKYGVFMNWSLGSDPVGDSTYSRVRGGALAPRAGQ